VERTNFAQNTTVGFSESALLGYTAVSNLRLLVDNDGVDWTNATVYSGATSVGGRVVFSGVDFTQGSFFTLATINYLTTPLPIELLSFQGETQGTTNHLTWSTATERNNDHFDLERSEDGQSFRRIGSLAGVGNTQQVTDYAFTDERPLQGLNYYRLLQVDVDGVSNYSNVVVLTNKFEEDQSCIVRTLDPEGLFALVCTLSERGIMELFSSAGQPLKRTLFNRDGTEEVDLRSLASGMYIVRITDDDRVKSYKLLRP